MQKEQSAYDVIKIEVAEKVEELILKIDAHVIFPSKVFVLRLYRDYQNEIKLLFIVMLIVAGFLLYYCNRR